ncbi:MAG: DUF4199 domain-containing protein [Gillisia sp.]
MKKLGIAFFYGIGIAIGLIAYFLILSLFGLHENPLFSLFNPVIVGIGMYLAIIALKRKLGKKYKYQKGFKVGIKTGFIATIIFTIFFGIYATELNPGFINKLLSVWDTSWHITIAMVLFTVAIMGFATTVVLTLAFMQLLKDSWNTKEASKHKL